MAASAIAALTDKWLEQGMPFDHVDQIIYHRIIKERLRQDSKFGSMPRSLNPFIWMAVIAEELSEAIAEIALKPK